MKAAYAQARDRWRFDAAIPFVSTPGDLTGVSGTHAIGAPRPVGVDHSSPHVFAPSPADRSEPIEKLQHSLSEAEAKLSELQREREELARRLDSALAELARVSAPLPLLPIEPVPVPLAPSSLVLTTESSKIAGPELRLSRVVLTSSLGMDLEVELIHDTHLVTGLEQDIAQGGLFVATYRTLPVGTRVVLELELGEGSVLVHGEVRWLREEREEIEQRPGLGVAFVEPSPDAIAALTELCRAQPARYLEF